MVLVVFRPSWKIVFAVAFFIAITWANPRLLGLADPYVFPDRFRTTYLEVAMESFQWHCQAAIAVLIYTLLAVSRDSEWSFPINLVTPCQSLPLRAMRTAADRARNDRGCKCINREEFETRLKGRQVHRCRKGRRRHRPGGEEGGRHRGHRAKSRGA